MPNNGKVMGDHFVLLVDRLLTESTLQAAIESKYWGQQTTPSTSKDLLSSAFRMDVNSSFSPSKLVECRICHDEDEESNMETPCSCCGSLKHAHRKCVQRWCNVKGDNICEICLQQYKPGYTAPPPLFHYGGIPINFSGNWEMSRRDLHNSQFIPMVATDSEILDADFDEYSPPTSRSLLCCRVIAIIFMVLLLLRHTLPFIISGAGEYSLTLLTLLMLRTIGILLPIYIMFRAFTAIQRRRHHQDSQSIATSDGTNNLPLHQSSFIRVL
ncbi:E3 ubiquitin-protein ligase MARCHF2-like isoform X1 [Juglans regia]|uniref:E3 ubiquitin-protein ligase MARCHF2-like isoform X1 n=2 Tax=Juglans regia TaxID=51240 RepID=A0A6P9F3Y2_JUGRE|nr:E3 ubiquitin-protein ligase MARCHF2-like isoform X1 [Juglans regia]XP_035550612.1 E3 ubiquitin-protein ligase MARCHF2-like isoform X1 [Juglans regia]XP_035550613.1 E3 ubiquitin-protein ligase MARCHF2-like isoform X1 [Juglans regia]XP_035550614.1 E3 ubiquitin-protein ligase MARCHF2-like isoform X1 [Juglans regia]XP_035550616.1 E3 ubiquitin-protein ligase MARCHF2-like isoform X1 [Juglans regia]XP_035550617.1 E3 ubiquitin-protein ligase MARCHF2-like isoform X1 [Juglans regia]XP_035550618.1 E3